MLAQMVKSAQVLSLVAVGAVVWYCTVVQVVVGVH
jgi:hypothetical protein